MGILDNILNKNKSINSANTRNVHADVPVLGRPQEEYENIIDDELPSVNRRKGKSKLVDMLGFATLLAAGLAMVYYINTDPKKVEDKPKNVEIASHLPPLVMPELPQPSPPAELTPVELLPSQRLQGISQPIPLQNAGQQANKRTMPTWLDRKMGGGLLVGGTGSSAVTSQAVSNSDVAKTTEKPEAPSPLALKLKTTVSPGVSANLLPDRNYLITKGTALDCALETAIDSTVPGLTTCRLTRDVYSDNGHVVLLDRGSQIVGEYQGGITAGQARIFVLWTRAKTPNGVIVSLDSPGTDTLGRSGHSGWVDRHFFERFGAAITMSLIKDGITAAQKNNTSSITIGGGGTDQIATEILKNTVNIPPTLYVNQGDHIQIMVARDLDFSSVYGLELKE